MARPKVDVLPVTSTDLAAFDAFFSAKGCPGFCWCAAQRFKDAHEISRERKRMLKRIENSVPVGVLAYLGDDAVGWCSVAPRRTYGKTGAGKSRHTRGTPLVCRAPDPRPVGVTQRCSPRRASSRRPTAAARFDGCGQCARGERTGTC